MPGYILTFGIEEELLSDTTSVGDDSRSLVSLLSRRDVEKATGTD